MLSIRPSVFALALVLGACTPVELPTPLALGPPPPPDLEIGRIRVYGHELPKESALEARRILRENEGRLLAAYERHLATDDSYAEGTVQYRIGVNLDGAVAEVKATQSDIPAALSTQLEAVLRDVAFPRGQELYAFQTLSFRTRPVEVLKLLPEFDGDDSVLIADVRNVTGFRIPAVAVTVRVMAPGGAKPLHVYRRRVKALFPPNERRRLRIPLAGEWATNRNSFVVSVRPTDPDAES